MATLAELQQRVLEFRDERDWAQFHTPRNLAAALSIEAGELQEELLWKADDEVAAFAASKAGHGRLSDEIADVMIFALLFADTVGIDLGEAVSRKLDKNSARYPVDLCKGTALKHDKLRAEKAP